MVINPATVALISTLLSAAGTGAAVYNQNRAKRDMEDQALEGMNRQRAKQREIDARLGEEVENLEASTPEDEQAASLDAYLSQLRANRASAEGITTPGVSRYGQDTAASQAGVQNYGKRVAGILSRLDAARDQRRNEGFSINRAVSDVQGTQRAASGEDFINRLRMSQIQPNTWVDAGSQLMRGVGSGLGTYAANMDPMSGLEEVNITAQPVRYPSSAWAGGGSSSATRRLPVPNQRVG